MPTLFELFVAEWLQTHLPSDYNIRIQYRAPLDFEKKFVLKGIQGFFYDYDPLNIFIKGVEAVFGFFFDLVLQNFF